MRSEAFEQLLTAGLSSSHLQNATKLPGTSERLQIPGKNKGQMLLAKDPNEKQRNSSHLSLVSNKENNSPIQYEPKKIQE